MKMQRFKYNLSLHGDVIDHWPEIERGPAKKFISHHPETMLLINEERQFTYALSGRLSPSEPAGLAQKLHKLTTKSQRVPTIFDELQMFFYEISFLKPKFTLPAALAIGLMIGFINPATELNGETQYYQVENVLSIEEFYL